MFYLSLYLLAYWNWENVKAGPETWYLFLVWQYVTCTLIYDLWFRANLGEGLCMITLTPSAAEKILETISKKGQEGAGLRVRVVGGGCSGLQYNLDLETSERKGDKVFESNGVKVFVDLKSLLYLKGTEIDFVDALQGGGFKFKNPNAHGACSCGESFH